MKQSPDFKKMAMKARTYNFIHRLLHDVIPEEVKYSRYPYRVLTPEQKLEAFEQIFKSYTESKQEMKNYLEKRSYRKTIKEARAQRELEKELKKLEAQKIT